MDTVKHILFISHDGMTDPLGQSQVIPYLSGLTKHGYRFTIISCDKQDKYAASKDIINAVIAPFPIDWISIPYHNKPPVISTIYDMYRIRQMVRRLQKKDPVLLVHTRPGMPAVVGLWMKKKYGVRFINDIRGFWADERIDGGMWNLRNPLYSMLYKYFKAHEYKCLERADYNISLTNAGKKEMLSWENIRRQPVNIKVIPCSADLDLFNPASIDPQQKEVIAQQLNIKKGDIIVSYLGSIGGWYLTNEMMQFCKMLSDEIPAVKLLFISPHRHEQIKEAAIVAGISPDKIITTLAKRSEVPLLLSLSAYSIFFIKPCFSKIASSPTKHGELMAMGIPVITNTGVGDVQEITERYNGGFLIKEFTDEAYEKCIGEIKSTVPADTAQLRKGAEETYALANAIQSYLKVYRAVLQE